MTEEEALAICYANLKGSKDKDLLGTARALQYLSSLPKYRTRVKLAEGVGVSREIVREFLTLLRFPKSIQRFFATNRLRLDQGDSLWQLARRRRRLLTEAAKVSTTLTAEDTRHLVDHLVKNPDMSVQEAKEAVLQSKTTKEREFHVVAPLSEQEYRRLVQAARRRDLDVTDLVSAVVKEWLRSIGDP